MKRIRTITLIFLAYMFCCAVPAAAAGNTQALRVRVNGRLMTSADGNAFPDADGSAQMSLRRLSEVLDADVFWEESSLTACFFKDGVRVSVPVGSKSLTVTRNGQGESVPAGGTVQIRNGCVYAPLRSVAEALGAYVDYAEKSRTVGIWYGMLTGAQIRELKEYPYTSSRGAVSGNRFLRSEGEDRYAAYYGGDRESFCGKNGYADAREHLYACSERNSRYPFEALDTVLENAGAEAFLDAVVREARAEIAYASDAICFELLTDPSCLYQEDNADALTATVRGILVMTCRKSPMLLSGEEMNRAVRYGFPRVLKGQTAYLPVDIHMNTQANRCVNIHTIVPLSAPDTQKDGTHE